MQESPWPLAHLFFPVYPQRTVLLHPHLFQCSLHREQSGNVNMKGHSPVYSCSWLLFLVTVAMFTPGLLITYLSVVLKKSIVSSVEQAAGIRIPSQFFLFPRISFCQAILTAHKHPHSLFSLPLTPLQ